MFTFTFALSSFTPDVVHSRSSMLSAAARAASRRQTSGAWCATCRWACSAGSDSGAPRGDEQPFSSILYRVDQQVAHVTLNRPERLNAIDERMPAEIASAAARAAADPRVRAVLLSGAGGNFCAGYDLKVYAEAERGTVPGSQRMPWDPYVDYALMSRCTDAFMSLWRCPKPVVCKIEGAAIGGGSDIALCCDVTVMADDARIGYPPARVWGCPTTAMWLYRVGLEQAKRLLLTGALLSGTQAAAVGLVGESVPRADVDGAVGRILERIVTVPTNQLWFQKQVINHAVEQMGLLSTQRMATIFDGMSRHTPEGVAFQERAHKVGFKQAVRERDSGSDFMEKWGREST
ncbi:PREDICTED: probable enoyl-CoA hydratase echA8 [Priapulus caudatus]|uniref:Probable enoyl-CoA hydratase echA8 n=1 Tax=Priapulus caudatus TaxID=37621 RepID=A0ABM1DVK8_PRICU|nr:PREDICTED: probable enoyl-CoA hydratase echA8 [Priapulus caudatus]